MKLVEIVAAARKGGVQYHKRHGWLIGGTTRVYWEPHRKGFVLNEGGNIFTLACLHRTLRIWISLVVIEVSLTLRWPFRVPGRFGGN